MEIDFANPGITYENHQKIGWEIGHLQIPKTEIGQFAKHLQQNAFAFFKNRLSAKAESIWLRKIPIILLQCFVEPFRNDSRPPPERVAFSPAIAAGGWGPRFERFCALQRAFD
jgi:hypothetical protein